MQTTQELLKLVNQNEVRIADARQVLQAARETRAQAVAEGTDPVVAARPVREAQDALEGLLESSKVLERRLATRQDEDARSEAKKEFDLLVSEHRKLISGYDKSVEDARLLAEEYVRVASEVLTSRDRSQRLKVHASLLADWYGFEAPEFGAISGKDERLELLRSVGPRIQDVEFAPPGGNASYERRQWMDRGRLKSDTEREQLKKQLRGKVAAHVAELCGTS